MRKRKDAAKGIISYIAALIITAVFALYLNGRTGWFFFSVMVILPAVSVFTTIVIRRYITVSAEISGTEIYKNNTVKVRITVKNRSYLPSPPVEIKLLSTEELVCGVPDNKFTVNVMPRSEQTAEADFTAKIWCAASAGAEKISISDYAGIFSLGIKTDMSGFSFKINIIPDIIDVQSSDGLLKNVNDAAAQNDDSEESRDSVSLTFNGVPGYDHREYVYGDPVKRINWKLSCKKDRYMVRLDEELLSSRHTVILDRVNTGTASDGEVCGEYMLGMLRVMVRTGIEADVWYYSGGQWLCAEIADEGNVEQLRFSLAGYGFSKEGTERVPMDEITDQKRGRGTSLLFYTPCYDEMLAGQITPERTSSKTDMSITVAAASVGKNVHVSGIWLLSADGHSEIVL